MNRRAKNILRLIFIILILISSILLVNLAWSKYRTSIDGEATAPVAGWSFKVDGNLQTSDVIDFAMTINPTNESVAEGVLAPGTSGEIPITVDATGTETYVEYTINFTITNKPANLKLYLDKEKTMEIAVKQDTENANKGTFVTKGFMDLASSTNKDNPVRTETIYWEWPYDYDVLVEGMQNENVELSSNSQMAWVNYNELDTNDQGKNIQIQISAIGTQELSKPEMSITLKNGNIVPLTKENAANYYGAEVKYQGKEGDTNTYRLFYVDFDNKYKDGNGTIYLKADWTANDMQLTSYANYETTDDTVFRNMNPKWVGEDRVISNNNEKVATWLTDPSVWNVNYASSGNTYGDKVNYAIGSPSIELYVDSYNASHGKEVFTLECNEIGYLYKKNGGNAEEWTGWYSVDTYRNGMYAYENRDRVYWWLASPAARRDRVCFIYGFRLGLGNTEYFNTNGCTPIVSLKATTPLELK